MPLRLEEDRRKKTHTQKILRNGGPEKQGSRATIKQLKQGEQEDAESQNHVQELREKQDKGFGGSGKKRNNVYIEA